MAMLPVTHLVLVSGYLQAKSLDAMASQGRLLLNCTGPYRFLGEPVVASCLRTGTDVIDLCGEPEFMDRCLLKFNKEAVEKKVGEDGRGPCSWCVRKVEGGASTASVTGCMGDSSLTQTSQFSHCPCNRLRCWW